MSTLRTFRNLVAAVVAVSPVRAVLASLLTVAVSLSEGVSLVLLVPLLQLVGLSPQGTVLNASGAWFRSVFTAVGVTPTLGSVLLLFLGVVGVRAVLTRWQTNLVASVREDFVSTTRLRLYWAIAGAEWVFLTTRRSSDFAHALTSEIGSAGSRRYSQACRSIWVCWLCCQWSIWPGVSTSLRLLPPWCWDARPCWCGLPSCLDQARASGACFGSAARAPRRHRGAHGRDETAKSYGLVERHSELFARLSQEVRDLNLAVTAEEIHLQ